MKNTILFLFFFICLVAGAYLYFINQPSNQELLYKELESKDGVQTMLIIKNGEIIEDHAFRNLPLEPHSNDSFYQINSITKSIISILIGIAIEEGFIESVEQSIEEYIPEIRDYENYDHLKKITIHDVLTMRTGLQWEVINESTYRSFSDRIPYVLNQPVETDPGTRFSYNSGTSYLLSVIIGRSTGKDALTYAEEKLFKPLNITKYRWGENDKEGNPNGGRGMYLQPYDLAKIGTLMLHEGVWEGKQIVPSNWVKESTRTQLELITGISEGYGYKWYTASHNNISFYLANGAYGQRLYVIPELKIVAVFTASIDDSKDPIYEKAVKRYIIDGLGSGNYYE